MALIKRTVILPVDDLTRMFGDYLGETHIPFDSKPVRLVTNPRHRGLLGLVLEGDHLQEGETMINFELKRIYSV